MDNPFGDLIPENKSANPFSDLVPSRKYTLDKAGEVADQFNRHFEGAIRDPLLGFIQGTANIPSGMMNLLNKTDMFGLPDRFKKDQSGREREFPYFNVAPDNLTSTAGEAASMIVNPGNVLKGLGAIPYAKNITYKTSDLLNKPFRAISDSIKEMSPEKHAKDLLDKLGSGAKNSEEVSTSLAKDIRNAHDMRNDEASIFFDHALDRAGKDLIYDKPDPLITTAMDQGKRMINKIKDLGIGDLYDVFKSKPSFKNAHALQSELGVMIREYEKNPHLTMEEARQISQLKSARDMLKEDIANFLEKRDKNSNENILPTYNKGIELYNEHVAPYLSSKKLRDIVRGGKTVTKDVHSIFDSPSDFIDKATGGIKIGSVNKIMQDLPESVKGKILFSRIGGYKNALKPEEIFKSLQEAESKGYSKYFTPELRQSMNEMIDKLAKQRFLKTAGKWVGAPFVAGAAGGLAAPFMVYNDTHRTNNME